jgi:predicted amidohydrolase
VQGTYRQPEGKLLNLNAITILGPEMPGKEKVPEFKASAIQMEMQAGAPEENVKRTLFLVKKALRSGAKLVVLPELFVTGFDYECIRELPQRRTEDCLRELRALAHDSGTVIVAGSVTMKERGKTSREKIFNTCHVIGSGGRTKAAYRKMHMFSLMDEDLHLSAGASPAIARTKFGRIAPCICFDIRFPEVARHATMLGAQILAVPAEFPHPRLDYWRTLLKARAIENQFFVIAANRVGRDPTGRFFGHSMVISPTGKILAEADEQETILTARIDLSEIEATRTAVPCLDRINPAVKMELKKKR